MLLGACMAIIGNFFIAYILSCYIDWVELLKQRFSRVFFFVNLLKYSLNYATRRLYEEDGKDKNENNFASVIMEMCQRRTISVAQFSRVFEKNC